MTCHRDVDRPDAARPRSSSGRSSTPTGRSGRTRNRRSDGRSRCCSSGRMLRFLLRGLQQHRGRPQFPPCQDGRRAWNEPHPRGSARARRRSISGVSYDVTLDLTTGPETFSHPHGRPVRQQPARAAPTFIDLVARQVHEVTLNGAAARPGRGLRRRPAAAARPGRGQRARRRSPTAIYMNTGEGLHRFVDPVDDEVYLYSQFEVADSRRVFAVFEQPDLKATFTFTVTAPDHWTVVSVNPTPEPEPAGDGPRDLAVRADAGPLVVRHGDHRRAVPRRAARAHQPRRPGRSRSGSSAGAAWPRTWTPTRSSQITAQGFACFEEMFDLPYPFEKYDQLFVPEFNAGAMENAGAVTLPGDLRLPLQGPRGDHRAAGADDPARAGAHVVRRPGDDALVERPLAQRVVRRVGQHGRPGRGDPLAVGLDDVQHGREVVGLPAGPARHHAPDRRRPSATSRTSRSTSTASPTPRAPRCSSSSSRTSGARSSCRACAATSRRTRGATPSWPTCCASSRSPAAATCAAWSAEWLQQAGVNTLRPAGRGRRRRRHHQRRRSSRRARPTTPCCARTGSPSAATTCRTAALRPHHPRRAGRQRRAHRRARAGRAAAPGPVAGQRRRPGLRQDPARPARRWRPPWPTWTTSTPRCRAR